ncbi:hypothetical protein M9H77_27158 [Catharanthus roseus]|uniref:Uncharacterized protein n=1 Tax=Catharanthus roseus TaxID=4058 RepID=A0ACC0ADB1_CATRO|nr:hypothetical protein M9H77_27158 [Catharanthus roseus]
MVNLYIARFGVITIFSIMSRHSTFAASWDIVARTRNPDWRFDYEPIPTLGGFFINNCKSKNHWPTIWKSVYTWRETPKNKFENIIRGTACSDLQGSGEFGTLLLLGHCHHPIQID